MFWNQNFELVTPKQRTDTHAELETPQNAKSDAQLNPQNAQMSLKNVPEVQYNIPGVFQTKVRQTHVRAQIWFILFMAMFTV